MALTKVTNSLISGSEFNLLDYGADPTGVADSTTAIQAWLNDLYASNASGYAPQGTYLTSGVTLTYSASKKFSIRGASKGGTVFKKTGSSIDPVFAFRISSGAYLELNLNIQDVEFDGSSVANVNGLDFNAAALVTLTRVRAKNCVVGLEGSGLLVSSLYDCDFSLNSFGARFSRGTGGSQPYANLVNINGCRFNGNTSWGLYYGQGGGLSLRGCDVEANGTLGDTNTGGVYIAATIDDETGYGLIDVQGTWFEANKGYSFYAAAATNGLLKMTSCTIYDQESTYAIYVGAIRSVIFDNVLAPSANATITCAAETQYYNGNVFAFDVVTTGATQVVGAYKTAVVLGTFWTATNASVGELSAITNLQTPLLKLVDGVAEPTTVPGYAFLYVDTTSGDLKIRFGDGTTKTIITDT